MKILIIGAGPGGYVPALRAAQRGAEVVLVEAGEPGGTCLNRGCIPTKTLVASADVLATVRKAPSFGIDIDGEVIVAPRRIVARKDKVVGVLRKGIRDLLAGTGVRLLDGRARFTDRTTVAVEFRAGGTETVKADRILIATGSRAGEIPGVPFDGRTIISSSEALDPISVPGHLVILGAGAIGCEFASIYREFGSNVTLLERMPRILPTEDEDISRILERQFRKRGISLLTGVETEGAVPGAGGVAVHLAGREPLEGDMLLVAVGRIPNTEGLGLDQTGIMTGPRGEIRVNAHMQTSVAEIYAAGDVTGGMMLAHVASREGIVAVDHMLGDERAHMSYSVVPTTVFTRPEVGAVGLREHQAREQGLTYRVGASQFRVLGKAHAMGEIDGFVKVIVEEVSERILGAHIIGPRASDLIHELALAMEAGTAVRVVAEMIHSHPTLAEGLKEACDDASRAAVHGEGERKSAR